MCPKPQDIKLWVGIALSRYLRKLKITYHPHSDKTRILPSSLYSCKSLVILKLKGNILLNVPHAVCLPSMKILHLSQNKFLDGEALRRFLSICPVLEDLSVRFDRDRCAIGPANLGLITVIVPSLQSLTLHIPCFNVFYGIVINTPSLKYLKLEDLYGRSHPCLIENMPNLREAYVDVRFSDIKCLIGSITSVKRLTICLEEAVYGGGFVFSQLEHLKLCLCTDNSSNPLDLLLKYSPHLRVLDIFTMRNHYDVSYWEGEASYLPECILSSLQKYSGRPKEKDLAVNIYGRRFSVKDCDNLV